MKSVYEKLINGDSLTNKEVDSGVLFFKALADDLFTLGPVFRLAAIEALRTYNRLYDFQQARKLK